MFAIVMCLVLLICTLIISSSVLCVSMVESMSEMCNEPNPALYNPWVHTVVKVCNNKTINDYKINLFHIIV